MDFHDFTRFLGKYGVHHREVPKVCAGLVYTVAAYPESSTSSVASRLLWLAGRCAGTWVSKVSYPLSLVSKSVDSACWVPPTSSKRPCCQAATTTIDATRDDERASQDLLLSAGARGMHPPVVFIAGNFTR